MQGSNIDIGLSEHAHIIPRLAALNNTFAIVYGSQSQSVYQRVFNPQFGSIENKSYTGYGMDRALLPYLQRAMNRFVDMSKTEAHTSAFNVRIAQGFYTNTRATSFPDLAQSMQGKDEETGDIHLLCNFAWLYYRLAMEAIKLSVNPDYGSAVFENLPSFFPKQISILHYQNQALVIPAFEFALKGDASMPYYLDALLQAARSLITTA